MNQSETWLHSGRRVHFHPGLSSDISKGLVLRLLFCAVDPWPCWFPWLWPL